MREGDTPQRCGRYLARLGMVALAVADECGPPESTGLEASAARSSPTSGPRVLATLKEFTLENERGGLTSLDDLHGSVWIADCIFTRCVGTRPAVTHRMAELAQQLGSTPSLRDVTIVVREQ